MSKTHRDFGGILLRRGSLSMAQLNEARRLHWKTHIKLADVLVQFGYVEEKAVQEAIAEFEGNGFVDLRELTIAPSIIDLVPESVARENTVLPLAVEDDTLVVAAVAPLDPDLPPKLQFILNRDVRVVFAPRDRIIEAIDRHYGPSGQGEAIDLAELTDTAIDFTTSAPMASRRASETMLAMDAAAVDDAEFSSDEFDLTMEEEASGLMSCVELADVPTAPAPRAAVARARTSERLERCDRTAATMRKASRASLEPTGGLNYLAAPLLQRQATIRYYHQMNPERMFPLLVIISKEAVQEIVKKHVAQKTSDKFEVAADAPVEIEPILPGCYCYPPRAEVQVGRAEVQTTFWIVPHVLGPLMGPRVVVRQQGKELATVPLEIRVVKQNLTILMGGMSFLLPMVSMFRNYPRDEAADPGWYTQLANRLWSALSPELLTVFLLVATVLMYLWLRPRQRDVFWDVQPGR